MAIAIAPELRKWIDEQLGRGCDPVDMVEAMIVVGHKPVAAREIIQQVMVERGGAAGGGANPPAPVPEPLLALLSQGSSVVETSDRKINVLMSMSLPRVVVFSNVLSDDECDALIAASRPKLARSQTVNRDSGDTELNAARTSQGTYFNHNETPLLVTLNRRIAELTRFPLENGEPLQILYYGIGAEYRAHYDYFDPADPGTPKLTSAGGQRVGTLILYLNTPAAGGATIFPDIGLEVAAIKGNAVFFSYNTPTPQSLTLHGGTPVAAGEKWIATRWIRERHYG